MAEDEARYSPLSLLVDDTILSVFSFVPLQDRGRAARVCRRWNRLMKASGLWTRVNFWSNEKYPLSSAFLPRSTRSTSNFWEFPRKEAAVLTFLQAYCGISLQTVHLNVVSPDILRFLRENCSNLKHLSYLPPTNHSFTTPLPSFTMTMGNEHPDLSFISCSIVNIQFTFHGRCISNFQSSKKKSSKFKRQQSVAILNIADVEYTKALFSHLCMCTHLRHLSLYHCSGVTTAAIIAFTKNIPSLETLHLMHFDYDQNDSAVLEEILVHIASNLMFLKSLRYMPMIYRKAAHLDVFMRTISNNQTLRYLWLPGPMLFFTHSAFADMVKGLVYLDELVLCQSCCVTDDVVKLISVNLKQLRVLNLRGCIQITDAGIGYLSHYSSLKFLDLRECHRTTTDAVLSIVLSIPEMAHVDISVKLSKKREVLSRMDKVKKQNPNLTVSVDYIYTTE